MKIIILHGAPGAGKLTIAKSISEHNNFKILHNHLTVDLALSVYTDFGEDDFSDFVHELRMKVLNKALQRNVEGLILTICYNESIDRKYIDDILNLMKNQNGEIIPVFLNPSLEVLTKRVTSKDRENTFKITDPSILIKMMEEYGVDPIPHSSTLTIDTSNMPVKEVREEIFHCFSL